VDRGDQETLMKRNVYPHGRRKRIECGKRRRKELLTTTTKQETKKSQLHIFCQKKRPRKEPVALLY